MADYRTYDDYGPSAEELKVQELRGSGFHPVWTSNFIGRQGRPDYYQCRRGCGTLVWDPEAHIKNVCTTFEPVVGK